MRVRYVGYESLGVRIGLVDSYVCGLGPKQSVSVKSNEGVLNGYFFPDYTEYDI